MKAAVLTSVLFLTALTAVAATHTDFSGSWQLDPEKSKNIGMMAQMKMVQTIQQSDAALDVTIHTTFQGRDNDSKTHYDLNGKPVNNELPMAGTSETVSQWQGDKLVTTWTSENAVAGAPKTVRTETRWLSADHKTMTVESVRGANTLMMVFDKQ